MSLTQQLAKSLKELYFGENWTSVDFRATLDGVTWQKAIRKTDSLNSIAALLYHTNYYVHTITQVLQGRPLDAHDKLSFDHPPVLSEEDWERMINNTWKDVDLLAALIEQLPDEKLHETFAEEKYGSYFKNISGLIEHGYYHLGQIVIIKKMLIRRSD